MRLVNKRSKIHFKMIQLKAKCMKMAEEKIELEKYVKNQLFILNEDMKALIMHIGSKIVETKLKCDYCDHHEISEFVKTTANKNTLKNMTSYQQYGKILKTKPYGFNQ